MKIHGCTLDFHDIPNRYFGFSSKLQRMEDYVRVQKIANGTSSYHVKVIDVSEAHDSSIAEPRYMNHEAAIHVSFLNRRKNGSLQQ